MKNDLLKSLLAAAFVFALCGSSIAADTEPLKLNLPAHTLKGTPGRFARRPKRRAAV